MSIEIRAFAGGDVPQMTEIWNSVVRDAAAFPQDTELEAAEAESFFGAQSFTGAAVDTDSGEIVGLYILHPNNVGRCGHICNASYAVKKDRRGEHIGELLVRHSLAKGAECGFRILQFNAVTASNKGAQALYEKIGFTRVGTVPEGFRRNDGSYDDIIIYREPLKTLFERKRAIHFMPLCMRASCALLAAIPRLPAVTVYFVKSPHRAPARHRSLSLYPTRISHFLFSKWFLEVPYIKKL